RRPAMKIFVVLELLSDQGGADHLAILLDQAALGLFREDDAGDRGHRERIGEARDQCEPKQEDDSGTNFSEHCCLLGLVVIARSEATKQSILSCCVMDCFASP